MLASQPARHTNKDTYSEGDIPSPACPPQRRQGTVHWERRRGSELHRGDRGTVAWPSRPARSIGVPSCHMTLLLGSNHSGETARTGGRRLQLQRLGKLSMYN